MTDKSSRDVRFGESGIDQPSSSSPVGRVVRSLGLSGEKSGEDHIPLQDAVRGEYAIRRDDGAYFGLIKVEPANLSTVDDETWERQVEQFASVLMSNGNGRIQIYSPMQSVDYGDRQRVYREQAQTPVSLDADGHADIRADIAEERASNVAVREQTTLSRTHYVGLAVADLDTTAEFVEDRGGAKTVPGIGGYLQKREATAQKDGDAHARAMRDLLKSRIDRLANAIRGLEGVGAYPLSSTKATQVIADHYGHDDAFAYDDFSSLVRQSPLVYSDDDDPEYPITHEHATHESIADRPAADGGSAVSPEQSRVQSSRGVSRPERTLADVVHTEPDALSDHYKSLLAAEFDTSDPGYVRIDRSTLVSTIAVRNWPRVPTYGMFSHVLSSSAPGVEIILSVQASYDDGDSMDQSVASLKQKWEKAEEHDSFTKQRDRQKYETASEINETRKQPNSALFQAGAYITIKSRIAAVPEAADNPVDWHNESVASVKRLLKEEPAGAGGIRLDYNQMAGLHSSAPIVKDVVSETSLMKDIGLASTYPWHARNLQEPGGVVVGRHRERDESALLDIFNRETGYNIGVFGTIGSGKTTTTKQILTRHKQRNPDTTIAVIDPLRDFQGVTEFFDGDRIVVGGDTPINPFRIEPTPEEALEHLGREIPFKTTIRQAKAFIETYYRLEGLNYESRKGTWERAIKLAYEWAGITENPDTHDRDSPTPMTAIWFIRDMVNNPGEYVDDALEDAEAAKTDRRDTAIAILNNDIEPFLPGGEYHNLTQPSQLNIEDGGFVYLDLQQYENDQETGGLMMQLLISQLYELTKSSENPSIVSFDEARYMFQNSADLGFLRQIVRHSRHYDLSMLFSTQQMGDFFEEREGEEDVVKESAKDILDNTSMFFFHYMKEMNDEWADAFDLSDAEHDYIKDAKPGELDLGYSEVLMRVDREGGFPLRVEMDEAVNPREFALYRYDPQRHGENVREYLRLQNDVCEWRWTGDSVYSASQRRQRRQEWADSMVDDTPKPRDIEPSEPVVDASTPLDPSERPDPVSVTAIGIDASIASGLCDSGYETANSVYHASNEELAEVDGIDRTKACYVRRRAGKRLSKPLGFIVPPEREDIDASMSAVGASRTNGTNKTSEPNQTNEASETNDDERASAPSVAGGSGYGLTSIAGIEDVRASTLRDAGFESVESIAAVDVDSLMSVDGFGESRSAAVIASAQSILGAAGDGGGENDD